MGCHSLLQGIFLTQVLNSGLPHCQKILYNPSHQGSPVVLAKEYNVVLTKEHKKQINGLEHREQKYNHINIVNQSLTNEQRQFNETSVVFSIHSAITTDDAVKALHSICQQIWKTQQWPQDWKRSVFIPTPKKGNAKECSNYHTIALISHASKIMFKILQSRLHQYVHRELSDVQAGFRKGRGTRDQIANILWIIKKAREFQKIIFFCFFDCVDHNKVWKILKEMGIPDHLTCLLRNLYASRKQQLEVDMEQQTGSK